jgi:hypothetical protein
VKDVCTFHVFDGGTVVVRGRRRRRRKKGKHDGLEGGGKEVERWRRDRERERVGRGGKGKR